MEIIKFFLVFNLCLFIDSKDLLSQEVEYDRTLKQYCLVEFIPTNVDTIEFSKRMEIQRQHLSYIKSLAEDRKLLLAGPFINGGGLFVLNTNDEEQAKSWVNEDPTIKSRLNSYSLRKWITEKGLLTLDNDSQVSK